jgi:ParB family chromosome partitioning protein
MRDGQQIERVDVDVIDIMAGHRCPSAADVARLADSIERIGLRTPVTVRYMPERPSSSGTDDSYILVTGAHRLAAVKKLGWTKIDCFVSDCDEVDAQLWEIAENLHRSELTALERDEQIAKWVHLVRDKGAQIAPPRNEQPNDKGIKAAVRELGIERTDVQRAVKVASIASEAKSAARAAGLDDNRSALLAAAKEATPEAQVAKISELAQAKVNRPTAKPAKLADAPLNDFETTEKQVAALMAAWNRAGIEAREQFLSRIDKPIMDRRFSA